MDFMTLQELEQQILNCNKCSVRTEATNPVRWEINNINSPVLLIGRNPGVTEDYTGRVFCGKGGKILNDILMKWNIKRAHLNVGNLLNCYTYKDRLPLIAEIRICFPYLQEYLNILKPRLVVAFGATTVQMMTGVERLSDTVNVVHEHKAGFNLVCCSHPGSVLRGSDRKKFYDQFAFVAKQIREILYK